MDLSFISAILQHAPVIELGWIPVVAGLATAYLGYKASKDASKSQNKALSAQQAWEAGKAKRAQEQIDLADRLLYGNAAPGGEDLEGVNSAAGGGAMGRAEDWTSNYLDWLSNSSDIIYNAQRGRMESDIRDSMSQAARMLGKRGLSTSAVQSGIANRTMGGIGAARTGLLSQLEAGRFEREGANLEAGTQLTQGLVDRALNLRSSATGQALNQRTQIPSMYQVQAAQAANRAGAYGNLMGGMIDYYMQSKQPSVQPKTT
jgi:hypothetical protein